MSDQPTPCIHRVEQYPGGFSCEWNTGRKDIPPHLSDAGYWLDGFDGCAKCPVQISVSEDGKK